MTICYTPSMARSSSPLPGSSRRCCSLSSRYTQRVQTAPRARSKECTPATPSNGTPAAQAGGRLSIVELPALLAVDLVHCERQAAAVVAESNGEVLEAQGELMTTQVHPPSAHSTHTEGCYSLWHTTCSRETVADHLVLVAGAPASNTAACVGTHSSGRH